MPNPEQPRLEYFKPCALQEVAQIHYRNAQSSQDFKNLSHLFRQAFVAPIDAESSYVDHLGLEHFRLLCQGDRLLGGLGLIPMGQWFGGRSVPMTGVASVAIAPEYRRQGHALTLLHHTLRELHHQEVALSALYPAVQGLYRAVGYEQAGHYCGWRIATRSIPGAKPELALEPININSQILQPIYQQQAPQYAGHLDRSQGIWNLRLQPNRMTGLFAYRLGSSTDPQGYLLLRQERTATETCLYVQDWAVLTAAAAQSVLAFLGNHGSLVDQVQWQSGAIDWFGFLLPEQQAKLHFHKRWMLRIINLKQALEARGYPKGYQGELHLSVQDPILPDNHGNFVLSVADGRGKVTPGGRGDDLQLQIQQLAPLYSGLFSPEQLVLAGKIEGSESGLAIAAQLFASSSPWMLDFF